MARSIEARARLVESKSGAGFHWKSPEIVLHPLVPGARSGLSGPVLHDIAAKAASSWNTALARCHAPVILIAPPESHRLSAAHDGAAVLAIRDARWCPVGSKEDEHCYSAEKAATTWLFSRDGLARDGDGQLAEADIEVNAVNYSWFGEQGNLRLEALLVHEFGHVLGLDHPCKSDLSCSTPEMSASIMYPAPLEVGRPLSLTPDAESLAVLCRHYGERADFGRMVSLGMLPAGVLLLILLWMLMMRRRRGHENSSR